jgi:hypothetical protein
MGSAAHVCEMSRWPSRHPRWAQLAGPAALYVVSAVILTWPLVLHLGSGLYLSPFRAYGDYTGTIANLHSLLDGFHVPFVPGHIANLNAPGGLAVNWGLNLITLPEITTLFVLGLLFGAVTAFELFVLLGFVASGVAMFCLVRAVTRRPLVALLFGWAFAFYPYAVANGEHPDYIHGWPLVLMVWAGLRALQAPSRRAGALAGAATVLAMAWTPYYLLLGGVALATEIAVALVYGWRTHQFRAQIVTFAIASGIALAYTGVVLLLSVIDAAAGQHAANTLTDVTQQSVQPVQYALAPSWNFLLGSLTGPTVVAHGWDITEKTMYLGVSVLSLALVGTIAALRGRLPPAERTAVLLAFSIAVIAAACSLAPRWHILGSSLYLPSWLLFHLTSGFRIYERFVILVELGLCLVAAVGLSWVLRGRRPAIGWSGLAAATAIVVCDLWAPIPRHFELLRPPAVFAILARQPPGIYADYPLSLASVHPDYHALFDQAYAHHPLLNGYASGSAAEARAEALADLAFPWVGGQLATLGVRYVLAEHHPLAPLVPASRPGADFVQLANDSYATLYRVDSSPVPVLEPIDGFSLGEGRPGAQFRWIVEPTAHLRIVARCQVCTGILSFTAASFARPRELSVTDASTRRRLLSVHVGPGSPVRLALRFRRQMVLAITATPGPQSITATTGSPDPRHVSVNLQNLQLRLSGATVAGHW